MDRLHWAYLFCCAGIFAIIGCSPTNPRFGSVDAIPRTDEEVLIEAIVRRAVVDAKDIPDYRLLRGKPRLFLINYRTSHGLYDPNQPPDTNWVTFAPQFPNLEIVLATPEEIQRIANAQGDFPFLALGDIEIWGDSASVELGIQWAQSEESTVLHLSGGGYNLFFVKRDGEWVYLPGLGWYWMS